MNLIALLAQSDIATTPVQYGHIAYVLGISVSLLAAFAALRKSGSAKDGAAEAQKIVTKIATEQSAACRSDHEGIRGILVAQGVVAAENTKNLSNMVASFTELATSIKIRDVQKDAEIQLREKDNEVHRKEMCRLLESIETKLTK